MTRALLVLALGLALAVPAAAQDDPGKRIEAQVFAPELVMKNARAINLSAEQRRQISEAVAAAQGKLIDLQWQLTDAADALAAALDPPRVDQAAALTLLDRVLGLEQQVKRQQMTLVIQIKNVLTPGQQDQLRALRARGDP